MADAKDLDAVLSVLSERGCVAQVVRVGDIVVHLAAPWGKRAEATVAKSSPSEDEQIAKEIEPHSAQAARMEKLRELSRIQLGRVYDDKTLNLLAPELLRGQS